MKKIIFAALAVLALFAGPAKAGSESYFTTHKVVKGNTLWGISHQFYGTGKIHGEIAKANKITNPRKLRIGTVLLIPVVPRIKIHNVGTAPFGAKAVQGDPKVLWAIDNIYGVNYIPEMKDALREAVLENPSSPYILKKGEKADCYSDKSSGQYGMYCPPNGFEYDWDKVGALRADFWSAKTDNLACLARVIEDCGNVDTWCWKIESPPPPPAEEVPAPPEPIQPPPGEEKTPPAEEPPRGKITLAIPRIPRIVPQLRIPKVKKFTCLDFELNARLGFWRGDSAHGEFSYAEAGAWDTCWGWGHMVGFYTSRDSGESDDIKYEWFTKGIGGIGPQLGLRFLDFYTNPDNTVGFHGYTAKLRFMYAKVTGKNPASLYHMTQEDLLVGLYLEYVRHISRKTAVALTFEVWYSLWNRMETTLTGDHISNRAWVQVGGYIQHQLSTNWANRTGIYGFYHWWDHEFGVGGFSEMRYYDTFLVGASANLGFKNGLNYGPYAGVELGNYPRALRDQAMENSIWAVDENGNPLASKDGQTPDASSLACTECVPAQQEVPEVTDEVLQESSVQAVTTNQADADVGLDNPAEPVIVLSLAEREEYDRLDRLASEK